MYYLAVENCLDNVSSPYSFTRPPALFVKTLSSGTLPSADGKIGTKLGGLLAFVDLLCRTFALPRGELVSVGFCFFCTLTQLKSPLIISCSYYERPGSVSLATAARGVKQRGRRLHICLRRFSAFFFFFVYNVFSFSSSLDFSVVSSSLSVALTSRPWKFSSSPSTSIFLGRHQSTIFFLVSRQSVSPSVSRGETGKKLLLLYYCCEEEDYEKEDTERPLDYVF
ncbi:uncharacterized protein IWZ02DRAFT_164110 [Phyllosticta citriasiana]|uniref:uncharacterized protein n=1 Tax=Phyllosticta citriasiana TaxID=595635 RepID=UPI0030FDCCED